MPAAAKVSAARSMWNLIPAPDRSPNSSFPVLENSAVFLDSEFCIPWKCIRQIGEDIILVEIDEDHCLKKL